MVAELAPLKFNPSHLGQRGVQSLEMVLSVVFVLASTAKVISEHRPINHRVDSKLTTLWINVGSQPVNP